MCFHKLIFRILAISFLLPMISQPASALNFSLLADIHVTPGNENEKQLQLAIEEINKNNSKFVILAGDLSNEGSDEQLYNIKRIFDKLNKPLYIIPGNHENNWSQSALKTFNDIWGDDRFVFEEDSLIFIGINCGPCMKMGDGHIKQEDLIWLDKELSTRCTPGKRVVSINHYPIKDDLDNWQDYVRILQKYPTIVHICGHYHKYEKYKGGNIDAVMCRALDMTGKQRGYGYSNVRIANDSIFIYDKVIGSSSKLQIAFSENIKHPEFKAASADFPTSPAGFSIRRICQDEASIFTRLSIDKTSIYFGNSLGWVKAIDKSTGKEIWSLKTEASLFSRPVSSDHYLIVPTADKRIIWVDKKTGRVIRENISNGPYVADGIIHHNNLFQGGYKKFESWNVNTGNLIWRAELSNYCQAEPAIDGNDVIFGAWDTYLRCLDAKTGKLKWQWNNGKNANMLSPGNCVPVVTRKRVAIVAPDRYMTVLDRKTGSVVWRSNFDGKYKVRESLGCSADKKTAYAKTMDGQLIGVDMTKDTPNISFVVETTLGYEHAPCIVFESEGVIYMGSRRGLVTAVDAKSHKLLWTYSCGSSEINGFEIYKKKIYISLTEGSIWEIEKLKQ